MGHTVQSSATRAELVARYLKGRPDATREDATPAGLAPRAPGERIPLTWAQEQVWLHTRMAPDAPIYNESVTIHYDGPLDVAALERSFNEILRRHEAWRSSIAVVDGDPVQVVHPELRGSLGGVDLRLGPEAARETEARRLASEDCRRPLDLNRIPLFRIRLMRLADERHRLHLAVSHLIFDGVAIYDVLLTELATLYRAFAANEPSPLPELAIQFGDYACWERRHHDARFFAPHMAFWKKQLAGPPAVFDLPTDRPRPPVQSFRGAMHPFQLDGRLVAALKAVAQREGATLFHTLLAGLAVLWHRYSGVDDIAIGTATSGRDRPEMQAMLGYLLNTIVLRLDLSGGPTFREVVARARDVTIESLAHDVVPFGHVVTALRAARDSSRNPFFQTMLVMQLPQPRVDAAWRLSQADGDTGATKYDIYLEVDDRTDRLVARCYYSTDLFDAPTIARMASHWTTVLEAMAADADMPVAHAPIMPESERRQVLVDWNATERPCPSTTVTALFEAQVSRTPSAVAVRFGHRHLTYAELNARANRLAWSLRARGVGRDVLVGLAVERSLDLVVALLAIQKAGGAYVPLDQSWPDERVAAVIDDAKLRLIVTERGLRRRFPASVAALLLDADAGAIARESDENPPAGAGPNDLVYVLYTSGSTGVPKGVQVEQGSLVNFLLSMRRALAMSAEDVWLAVTTLSFDIAALELYLPLLVGAQTVIAESGVAGDGRALSARLRECRATVMQATPTTWQLLTLTGWRGSPRLKILSGGEALDPALARTLARCGERAWNLYGPTETTVWSTCHRLDADHAGPVPIGRPIDNTRIYIVDRRGEPVPIGVSGEICIAGAGVARGYLNRPELNAGAFVPEVFGGARGTRMYLTGDVGRFRPDGTVEFLGRSDTQVKIRGHRAELGEIETVLLQHPRVRQAAVVLREDTPGDRRLVGYVRVAGPPADVLAELRQHLKQKLPAYMVPAHLVPLGALPRTTSGKIDRRALPPPGERPADTEPIVHPRDEIETELVRIWESLLGTHPVGVCDDFFELGGDSILAMRMALLVERTLGKPLPLATLLRAPTVEQVAEVLRGDAAIDARSPLVPIQAHGSRPPLFFVHGHFGEVLFYRALAGHLGPDQPFYGLQAVPLSQTVHHTIQAKAAAYLAAVREVQPHGPFFLGGFCLGATVAFEMAHQLLRQGERVALLAQFMGHDPDIGVSGRLAARFARHRHEWRTQGAVVKLRSLTRGAADKAGQLLWRAGYRLLKDAVPQTSPLFRNVPGMNLEALRRYEPRRYPGRMTVFLSGVTEAEFALDPAADLDGLTAAEIDLQLVPGERDTMMHEPFVGLLAEHLRERLARARSCPTAALSPAQSSAR